MRFHLLRLATAAVFSLLICACAAVAEPSITPEECYRSHVCPYTRIIKAQDSFCRCCDSDSDDYSTCTPAPLSCGTRAINCAICTDGAIPQCLVCNEGYVLFSTPFKNCNACSTPNCGKCIPEDEDDAKNYCVLCSEGMTSNQGSSCATPSSSSGNTCRVNNCKKCVATDNLHCETGMCVAGYVLQDGLCIKMLPPSGSGGRTPAEHCIKNTPDSPQALCQVCDGGYMWDSSTMKCDEDPDFSQCAIGFCLGCSADNPRQCSTGCNAGYKLVEGICYAASPTPPSVCASQIKHCQYCVTPDKCSACEKGYILSSEDGSCYANSECSPSQRNCEKCNFDPDVCTECESGYFLPDGIPGTCVKSSCTAPQCMQCKGNTNECVMCLRGYELINGKCTRSCNLDPYCAECDPTDVAKCLSCVDGYKQDNNGVCQKSSPTACRVPNCNFCDPNDPTRCTKGGCAPGLSFHEEDGDCWPPCYIEHCEYCKPNDPNSCRVCLPGYKLCEKCGKRKCKSTSSGAEHSSGATALASTLAGVGLLYALNA